MSELDPNHFRKNGKSEKKSYQNDFFKAIHTFIGTFAAERSQVMRRQKEASLLDQFILNIKKVFKFSNEEQEKEQRKLLGRIHELNKNAADVLNVLNTVREDLKNEIDDDLYEFVELVMNPMIRDISRIQKIVKKEALQAGEHHKAAAFNQYNQWIDRAKLWVEVCSVSKSKDAISEAIIKHTFEDFTNLIDRDVQLIMDYQEHLFDETDMTHDQKEKFQKELEKILNPYFKNLKNLKDYPKNLSLEDLNQWKDHADKRRDRYFNAILQTIDQKFTDLNPSKSQAEELDAYVENLEQIAYLEMEIPILIEKLENASSNPFEKDLALHQLLSLQEETDHLYHDIGMPQEMIERLQFLRKLLKKAFTKLKKL